MTIDESVTLWNNGSQAAKSLRSELSDQGYQIREKFSGASQPVAQFGSKFFSGYVEIRNYLL